MVAGIGRKHWFALIVLLTMSAHYFYFRVPFIANDYGRKRLSCNADEALANAIHGRFAGTGFAPFALFEARIW